MIRTVTTAWFLAGALAGTSLSVAVTPAHAAAAGLPLFVQGDFDPALVRAIESVGTNPQRVPSEAAVMQTTCSTANAVSPLLALLERAPSDAELDRCRQMSKADVTAIQIGWEAVAVIVPTRSPVWSADATTLFRAVGQNSLYGSQSKTWNDIDPAYPALPIGLLPPSTESTALRLFDKLVMQVGCTKSGEADLPLDVRDRAAFCTSFRKEILVAPPKGDAQNLTSWATNAAPGQIAVGTLPELQSLDGHAVSLLFDGALPTVANIQSGHYGSAERIELLIVAPSSAGARSRGAARKAVLDLLAETSMAPGGTLAAAGLIPVPPADRVAARTKASEFLQQR